MTDRRQTALYWAIFSNFIWINLSEVARYIYIVRPALLRTEGGDVAPMGLSNLLIWAAWDSVLIIFAVLFYVLWLGRWGPSIGQVLKAASLFTLGVFGLLWVGLFNMGLVRPHMIAAALPLAWIEQIVAAGLCAYFIRRANLAMETPPHS